MNVAWRIKLAKCQRTFGDYCSYADVSFLFLPAYMAKLEAKQSHANRHGCRRTSHLRGDVNVL